MLAPTLLMKYSISVVLGGINCSTYTGLTSDVSHWDIVSVKLCPNSLKFHRCRAPCQYLSPLPRPSGLPGGVALAFFLVSVALPKKITKYELRVANSVAVIGPGLKWVNKIETPYNCIIHSLQITTASFFF